MYAVFVNDVVDVQLQGLAAGSAAKFQTQLVPGDHCEYAVEGHCPLHSRWGRALSCGWTCFLRFHQ